MDGFERLFSAIDDCDVSTMRQLIEANPLLLNQVDSIGATALMHAVGGINRDIAIIQLLLDSGAAVNCQTREGYSALHCAIDVGFEANLICREVFALLVGAGADLTLRQHYGWTPLMRAVVEGTAAEVDAILSAGADPNDTLPQNTLPEFNAGCTTLMAAVPTYEAEAKIELLLRAGADPWMRDSKGITFFDFLAECQSEHPKGEFAEKINRCESLVLKHVNGFARCTLID